LNDGNFRAHIHLPDDARSIIIPQTGPWELYFGTMSNADARRSLDLFAEKVMPAIARL
jgi:hypothetical protein